jgi:hypothetical protein
MVTHRRLCRVKNMLAMYLKYHKAGLTPTTPVKMSIGRKSLTNLRSEMIFLQGKPVFYIFLPSTPPYLQIILRFCWQWTPKWQQSESRSRATYFRLSDVLFKHNGLLHNLKEKNGGTFNLIENILPKTFSTLYDISDWRYRTEYVFGSVISTRLWNIVNRNW